ncbi:RteC domain-containing protein, partial [Dysgonomonas sp.]|uniref:RteC domain-containing protein n=1 Tax=Dysgonomonas sp. TaxID=1891233 RepID=UPI0028A6A960
FRGQFRLGKRGQSELDFPYINNKLLHIGNVESNIQETPNFPKTRLTWTAKKAELVEQIYAWDSAGCFNNGNTNIKELAEYIETVFNINLGDFYHTFLEIRERKGSRTLFLDKLIKLLEERMDGLDNK